MPNVKGSLETFFKSLQSTTHIALYPDKFAALDDARSGVISEKSLLLGVNPHLAQSHAVSAQIFVQNLSERYLIGTPPGSIFLPSFNTVEHAVVMGPNNLIAI